MLERRFRKPWLTGTLAVGLALAVAQQARADLWPSFLKPAAQTPAGPPQKPHPAVVRVIAPENGGTSYGSGTLVDVRGDYGLVLTNWHVVSDATHTIEVLFPDGFRTAARVITTDRTWDLAALAIWRPNVSPVKLASRPPQPGEPLTIAGYGSGTYRAITGRCTQYVAPSLSKPYEMVEVSVAARQGDSGGPIFNSQGELAGVLWGAGWGTTSGSYCGRVSAFVAAIMPPPGVGEETQIARNEVPVAGNLVPVQYDAPAQSPRATGVIADHQTTSARDTFAAATVQQPRADSTTQASQELSAAGGETNIPETSAVEQIQLFLAFVGGAALVLHAIKLFLPGK